MGVRFPTRRCAKCGDAGCDFAKKSMWKGGTGAGPKVGPNAVASGVEMQARGTEHAFGLNSLR